MARLIKKIFKWLGLGLLLGVFLIFALPWFPVITDTLSRKKQINYLTENSVALDLSKADGGFAFDDDFYSNQLFMLGEMHGYARVQNLDLALLTHLNERLGVQYYMAEIDPATAMIFNYALRTGDDEALLKVFDIWYKERQSQWGNINFLEKLRSIRDLNATLPEAQKISFIGVDGPPKEKFIALAQSLPASEESTADTVNQELLKASLARSDSAGRYAHIINNVGLMKEAMPDTKFYGLWGISHIQKVGINGFTSLSSFLNKGTDKIPPAFENSVATIHTLCVADCSNMMISGILPGVPKPENGEPFTEIPMSFDNTYLFRTRGIGAAKSVMGNTPNMLFDMNNPGSPYMEGSALVGSTGYMSMIRNYHIDGAAAENFDALILMNGSLALQPIEGKSFIFAK
ncbi:hypothetical protein N9M10_01605 [Hellea sp.]|nr:hypothetical protein [Hellea sp.]